jgi:hypothetical protein
MSIDKVRGLAEANSLFDRLPADAEDQLGVELAIIGREILADQRVLVPKDTGELDAHLSLQLLLDRLKVRVGLFIAGRKYGGKKRVRGGRDAFYGRFVALGRAAQTVIVTRKAKLQRLKGNNHKNGTLRRGVYAGKPYALKVKAMAARDFIRVPGAEATAAGQLAEFWSRLLDRQGTSA